MTGKLRIALVGSCGMGSRWAKIIAGGKNVLLSVVCDEDFPKAEACAARSFGCHAESNWKNVAAAKNIDAAVVVLPHNMLAPVTHGFLKNKKHILCEKPGGMMSEEIRKNIAVAKKNNVRYMVGFNHR